MSQRSVIVLGMHRSGTSLVTGVLHHLGVDMGEPRPPVIQWDSPLGQYEDQAFVRLDDAILKRAGSDWINPPLASDVKVHTNQFRSVIQELIESKKSATWGFKTARNAFTIDLYLPHLPDPHFIVCRRCVQDIADSLARRNNMTIENASKLYDLYYSAIGQFLQDHEVRAMDVYYDRTSIDKVKIVDEITSFLGLRVTSKMRSAAIESILPHRAVRQLSDQMKFYNDIKLDIGCGNSKPEGWIGMDKRRLDDVDIVWDLESYPWPLANNSCNEIKCSQVWEIIEPKHRLRFMDEMWRIAKPGAPVQIDAPHSITTGACQDPIHYTCPNEITFWYFDKRHPRYYEYEPLPWKMVEQIMASNNVVVTMTPEKS